MNREWLRLKQKLRTGEISKIDLEIAADCGHSLSRQILKERGSRATTQADRGLGVKEWVKRLGGWDDENVLRFTLFLANDSARRARLLNDHQLDSIRSFWNCSLALFDDVHSCRYCEQWRERDHWSELPEPMNSRVDELESYEDVKSALFYTLKACQCVRFGNTGEEAGLNHFAEKILEATLRSLEDPNDWELMLSDASRIILHWLIDSVDLFREPLAAMKSDMQDIWKKIHQSKTNIS